MTRRYQSIFGLFLIMSCNAAFSADILRENTLNERPAISQGIPPEIRHVMDRAIAPIKNEADLTEFIAITDEKDSPLSLLSPAGFDTFVGSLIFTSKGLASFNHAILEKELTPIESYAVLELFGFQEAISTLNNEQIKNHLDAQIKLLCDSGSIGGSTCDNPIYVQGKCIWAGTCDSERGFTCHPPSCTGDRPET